MARTGQSAIPILLVAMALASPAHSQTAASAAEAANKLVAALSKGDIPGATAYVAAADRERCTALLQASDRLVESRTRFQQTMRAKLEDSPTASALLAHTKSPRIDHIVIVAQRQIDANAADLDVKSFGSENRTPPNASTWRAVLENGQWRIQLPPCTSDQAMLPLMHHYQSITTATDEVNASVQQGAITSFSEAHGALLKAERGLLSAKGARQ